VPVLPTSVDLTSDTAAANRSAWGALRKELVGLREAAAEGGPPRARERHLARGKLLPRERVMRLLDPGSPFLELRARGPRHVRGRDPRAGIITGFGGCLGSEVMVVCNDSTIRAAPTTR
jgi:3-methylcrotonyl-CoA carboxylase beta subunit